MSYNANIPVITDPLLQSQRQIRANFQAINQAFATNHIGLTKDKNFSGMHSVVVFQPQGSDPVTTATQTALYNKLVSGIPELFYAPNSGQTPIQLTYPSIKADSSTTQHSFIAGPFIIHGGFIAAPTNGQVVALTPGSNLLYVDLTIADNQSNVFPIEAIPTSIAGNSFTIKFRTITAGTFNIFYFAIGI